MLFPSSISITSQSKASNLARILPIAKLHLLFHQFSVQIDSCNKVIYFFSRAYMIASSFVLLAIHHHREVCKLNDCRCLIFFCLCSSIATDNPCPSEPDAILTPGKLSWVVGWPCNLVLIKRNVASSNWKITASC
jgi:hypothetical protein